MTARWNNLSVKSATKRHWVAWPSFFGWQDRGGLARWGRLFVGDGQRQETAPDPYRAESLVQLAFSADAKSLLTLGTGGQASAVWDVVTGKCIRSSEGKAGDGLDINDQNALVSPGWKYLAYLKRNDAGNRLIHTRDLASGKELPQIDMGGFGTTQTLAFSADDTTLIWDDYPARGIVLSDVTTGKELRRLRDHSRQEGDVFDDQAMAIALSPDGKSLAVCRMSHTIDLWNLSSGKLTYPLGPPTEAQLELRNVIDMAGIRVRPALAFSADGKRLTCSLGGETAREFQADTGTEILVTDDGHRWPVSTLALSADGKSLYTYAHGDPVRVWDWATGKETGQFRAPDRATHAVFSTKAGLASRLTVTLTFTARGASRRGRLTKPRYPSLFPLMGRWWPCDSGPTRRST